MSRTTSSNLDHIRIGFGFDLDSILIGVGVAFVSEPNTLYCEFFKTENMTMTMIIIIWYLDLQF